MMNVTQILAATTLIGSLLIPSAGVAQTLPAPGALRQSIQREAVRLASAGAQTATKQQRPHRSWAAEHAMFLGAIVGGTTGAMMGAASCDCEGVNGISPFTVLGGGIGVGLGMLVGAVVKSATR